MLPRFHWSDITTVGHYLGVLILLTGAAMCVPAAIALAFGEYRQFGAFLAGIGVCFSIGSALRFLRSRGLDRRRSLLLVGFGWLAIGIVAAVPFMLSGAYESWFDALFDSVSALTSTGVSLAQDIDGLGYAQVSWHVIMSFAGALAVIIIALYSGFFGEGPRLSLMSGRRDGARKRQRMSEACFMTLRVFGLFALVGTAALTVVCLVLGLSPIDAFMNAVWLALTAVGTGGFVAHTSELIYYHSLVLELILCVLMVAGAISFGVYIYVRVHRYRQVVRNFELRFYIAWIIVLVAFVTAVMTREGIFSGVLAYVQNGLTTVVSAVTTCGMQAVYSEQMGRSISDGVVILIIIAMLFGACAYSSGGGIKFVRILQVLRWIKYSILVRLAPDNARVRIRYEHFGSQSLSSEDAMIAMTVFILYLGTAALGSMAFIAYGNDALDSVFEAISYVSNCGMTTEITQQGLPFGLKVVALLLMWAGRVEFIALIAAIIGILISLHPENLFSNDRSRDLRDIKGQNSGGLAWRRRKRQKPRRKAPLAAVTTLVVGLALAGMTAPAAQAALGDAQPTASQAQASDEVMTSTSVDIRMLLAAGERQDGREVEFSGEATGEPINADARHRWVNVKSNGAMIGVYMDEDLAGGITSYARYEHGGDVLVITGTYHLACEEHNGELDVHASDVRVVLAGTAREHPVQPFALVAGVILVVIGLALTLVYQSMRGRLRFRWRSRRASRIPGERSWL